ncbi:MAG TPA: hypothetical protein VIU11_16180 [Nakamurella sp.]
MDLAARFLPAVTSTEPARPSRPEQVTKVRRRTTTQPPAQPAASPAPAPVPDEPATTPIPRITPTGWTPAVCRRSRDEPTRVIPIVAPANAQANSAAEPAGPATAQRPAAGQLHRQVWNGQRWVLADDDRVFHPARTDLPATAPADDTAVFRPRTRRRGPRAADPKPAPPAGPAPLTTRGGSDQRTHRLALALRGRLIA